MPNPHREMLDKWMDAMIDYRKEFVEDCPSDLADTFHQLYEETKELLLGEEDFSTWDPDSFEPKEA